jgi:beta-1,4-mannosyl-glycoprotein beta-1,4-N-acetylglucosaminyltransferase
MKTLGLLIFFCLALVFGAQVPIVAADPGGFIVPRVAQDSHQETIAKSDKKKKKKIPTPKPSPKFFPKMPLKPTELPIAAPMIDQKVYDCFLFCDELEVLDIRLHTLYDFVDYFVLVESCETLQGEPKPFLFEMNKSRYTRFLDKIIHIKNEARVDTESSWVREAVQRNEIGRGLTQCNPVDIVFISDVDEIFRKDLIPSVKGYFTDPDCVSPILGFEMKMYTYYINRPLDTTWKGSLATTYSYLKGNTPQTLRDWSRHTHVHPGACNYLMDGGWRFAYLGGVEGYKAKWRALLKAFSHESEQVFEQQEVLTIIESGPFCQIDASFPQYIRDNQSYYKMIGFIHQ